LRFSSPGFGRTHILGGPVFGGYVKKAKVDLASEIDSIIGTYEDGTEMSEAS